VRALFTTQTSAGPQSLQSAELDTPTGLAAANAGCTGTTQQSEVSLDWSDDQSSMTAYDGTALVSGYSVGRSTSQTGTYTTEETPTGTSTTDVNPTGASVPLAYIASGSGATNAVSVNTSTYGTAAVTLGGAIGDEPNALAATPNSSNASNSLEVIVAESASHQVQIINTSTGSVTATVTIPTGTSASSPVAVAVSPNGSTAWVVDSANARVYPLALSNNTLGAAITVGTQSNPTSIAVLPNGSQVFVGDYGSHEVSAINTTTDAVTNITIGGATGHPIALVATPNSSHVYVADQANNQVDDITTSNDAVSKTITVGSLTDGNVAGAGDPNIMAATPDGTKVYVASYTGHNVSDINVAADTATTITLHGTTPDPDAVAITPNGCQLYVVDHNNKVVDAITVSSDAVAAYPTVTTVYDPEGIMATPDSTQVILDGRSTRVVDVIGTSTNTVTHTLTLAAASTPTGIVIPPSPYWYEVTANHGTWASAASSAVMYPLGFDTGGW